MTTALFVDGSNTHAAVKALRFDIDYARVRKHYGDTLLRAYYYTAILDDTEGFVSIRPLVDYLSYNGWSVVTKATKSFTDPLTGMTKVKGDMDGELIVQAMQMIPYIDHMVLFSGDGDFKPLILAMQSQGIRCDVVSTIKTEPAMCADELRRACDTFHDLDDLRDAFVRKKRLTTEGELRGRYG